MDEVDGKQGEPKFAAIYAKNQRKLTFFTTFRLFLT